MKVIIYILIILIARTSYSIKDCPGDMVLWRQPGTDYSDCVCPTGQSMVTNGFNNKLPIFGRCSENYIPISRTWASDINSNLRLWFDADDPYGNGYRPVHGTDMSVVVDKSNHLGDITGAGVRPYQASFTSSNYGSMPNYSIYLNTTHYRKTNSYYINAPLIFIVFKYPVSQTSMILNFTPNTGGYLYLRIYPTYISFYQTLSNSASCGGIAQTLGYTITTNSTIAPVLDSNQIIVASLRANTQSIALINSNSNYSGVYSSAAAYVTSATNNCTSLRYFISDHYIGGGTINAYINEILIYEDVANVMNDATITKIISKLNQKWNIY